MLTHILYSKQFSKKTNHNYVHNMKKKYILIITNFEKMNDLDLGGVVKKTKRHCHEMVITEKQHPYIFHRVNLSTLYEFYRIVHPIYKKFDSIVTDYEDKVLAVSPQELYFSPFNCIPLERYLPNDVSKEDIYVYENGFNLHLVYEDVSQLDDEWCICDTDISASGWGVLPMTTSSMFLYNRLKYEVNKLLRHDLTLLLDKQCCYTIRYQDPAYHPRCEKPTITFTSSYKIMDDTIVRSYPVYQQLKLYEYINNSENEFVRMLQPIQVCTETSSSIKEVLSECFTKHVQVIILNKETQSHIILSKSMFMYINEDSCWDTVKKRIYSWVNRIKYILDC